MGRNQDTLASAPRASVGLHVVVALLGIVFALLRGRPGGGLRDAEAKVPAPVLRSFLLDSGRYTTDGGLLLERGVFRPLPDVPGAAPDLAPPQRSAAARRRAPTSTTPDVGTPRIRGFLMEKKGRVTRIDVPGAMANAAGRNQRPRPGRGRLDQAGRDR